MSFIEIGRISRNTRRRLDTLGCLFRHASGHPRVNPRRFAVFTILLFFGDEVITRKTTIRRRGYLLALRIISVRNG